MFHAAETQIISSYEPLLYVCILLVHLSHQITDDGLNDENINEFPMLIIQTFRVMHSCHILHVHLFWMHFLTQVSCRFDTLHLCSCVCAFLHALCLCGCVLGVRAYMRAICGMVSSWAVGGFLSSRLKRACLKTMMDGLITHKTRPMDCKSLPEYIARTHTHTLMARCHFPTYAVIWWCQMRMLHTHTHMQNKNISIETDRCEKCATCPLTHHIAANAVCVCVCVRVVCAHTHARTHARTPNSD